MKSGKSSYWFWAWVLLVTYPTKQRKPNSRCTVWKNLVLVRGSNERTAYENAYRIGKNSESKPSDRLTVDGNAAEIKFLGIVDMGFIHEPLDNGCELYFKESKSTLKAAKKSICAKGTIVKSLALEWGPYKRNKWNPHTSIARPETNEL